MNEMKNIAFLSAMAISLLSAHAFTPVKAGDFAWGCFGPQSLGTGLRIDKASEPGSDVVVIRTQDNKRAIKLTAAGPQTQITIPSVGRNGEDGIMTKRVYTDNVGRRWIYSNLDAHLTFKLEENSDVVISCSP